jgi:hypothetical protein
MVIFLQGRNVYQNAEITTRLNKKNVLGNVATPSAEQRRRICCKGVGAAEGGSARTMFSCISEI